MHIPKFKEFISEDKDEKLFCKILIITDEPEEAKTFHTADRLKQEAEKLKLPYYLYKLTGGYITFEDNIRRLHNKDDPKGFEITSDTVAIIRGSITRKDSWMDIVSTLEKDGICVVNSRQCISICADKYRTYLKLADYSINQPTTALITDAEKSKEAFEKLDTKYPIILKTLRGSKGVGVLFVESEKGLDSLCQVLYKQDEDADLLLQEFIPNDYDVRVLVLGGKILANMKRPVIEGDFRSNVSQGSEPVKIDLTEVEITECLKAAKAVGGLWTAVDFIPSKNREKEPPYILEVNSSPGTEGIEKASGQNISKEVIEFFMKESNRIKVPDACGFKEIVTIKPFGEIVAKFDTGNSGMSVIHADKTKVKGKTIAWTLLGKTVVSQIIRKEKIKVGGLRDYEEDRYVVKLDMEFAGKVYSDILFTIDDREDRTPILLDRETMNKLNVMVSPRRKYVMTTHYELDK